MINNSIVQNSNSLFNVFLRLFDVLPHATRCAIQKNFFLIIIVTIQLITLNHDNSNNSNNGVQHIDCYYYLLFIVHSVCIQIVITLYFLLIVSVHLMIELSCLYCCAIDCSLDRFLVLMIIVIIIIIITKYNNLYTNYVL